MNNELHEFFAPKHKRLLNIAMAMNIFAWLMLFFFIFSGTVQLISLISNYFQASQFPYNTTSSIPIPYLNNIVSTVGSIFYGVVYWLILKGISLGLSMIVETDINYRERMRAKSHGQ